MKSNKALIIFIKNAEKGKVKTRLAATVGEEQALKIYLALLQHTRQVSLKVEARRYVFYSHFIEKEDAWKEVDFLKKKQSGDDLGERMTNAFEEILQEAEKAIIIGSDCASLTPKILEMAFEQLEHHHYVVGPAQDGGYYLLGMRVPTPQLFQEITWSTETVLSETLKKIKNTGKTYHLLPELSDIDYAEDWEKYGWRL